MCKSGHASVRILTEGVRCVQEWACECARPDRGPEEKIRFLEDGGGVSARNAGRLLLRLGISPNAHTNRRTLDIASTHTWSMT